VQWSKPANSSFPTSEVAPSPAPAHGRGKLLVAGVLVASRYKEEELKKKKQLHRAHKEEEFRRRSSYTVHTQLRRNERLAIERSQQTDVRDCQEPLLQKAQNAKKKKNSEEEEVLHGAHATTSQRTAG
jgi:hypothetical protein